MTTRSSTGLTIHRVAKAPPKLDIALALLLSAYGVILVSGLVKGNSRHAGAAAAAMVLLMTLPVAWRRPAPVAVALVLVLGAALNPLVIGEMVRCGPALPALLLCAYSIGRRPVRGLVAMTLGLAFLAGSATIQSLTDPNLDAGVIVVMVAMIVGLYIVGRLVDSRTQMASELERRNDQLRGQRARRSELAVQADRARIARGLGGTLNAQIVAIDRSARSGHQALQQEDTDEAALEAFESIQQRGRETLTHMRRVVGTLLDPDRDWEPQPSLSQLDRLLTETGSADVHLHVTGAPTVLPAGVELSAYRIVEHLVRAYGDSLRASIDVHVDFAAEALTLSVRGPRPPDTEAQAALASARARVAVLRGSLTTARLPDGWEATVSIPLDSGE